MDCVFCKIIEGKIPSYKVYEDEKTLAFLDINPANPGHTLIVPKEHFANMEDAPEEVICAVMKTAKIVGKAIKAGLGVGGYNLMENNDPIAGQIIPHLHFHLIPRLKNDGLKLWPQKKYNEGEAEEIRDKILRTFKG